MFTKITQITKRGAVLLHSPFFKNQNSVKQLNVLTLKQYVYFLIILVTLPSARTIYTPAGR